MTALAVLNVGAGDTKLTFDPSKPAERERACRTVKDMLRRGYCLLIEVGSDDRGRPLYRRAEDFDENTAEYIIAFDPPETQKGQSNEQEQAPPAKGDAAPRRGRRGRRRISATTAGGVAISPVAGG